MFIRKKYEKGFHGGLKMAFGEELERALGEPRKRV